LEIDVYPEVVEFMLRAVSYMYARDRKLALRNLSLARSTARELLRTRYISANLAVEIDRVIGEARRAIEEERWRDGIEVLRKFLVTPRKVESKGEVRSSREVIRFASLKDLLEKGGVI